MCVILHRISGNPIPESELVAAHQANPDGCGLMYIDDNGAIVTEKGLWDVPTMLEKVRALGNREFCLHFRIKTHGKVDENNCHPFSLGETTAMMHNGTLSVKTPDYSFSDTWHFAKYFREDIKIDADIHDEENLKEVSDFHGLSNRMCFMSPGVVSRTGNWSEHGGNWWSNTFWKSRLASAPIVPCSQVCNEGSTPEKKDDDDDTVVVEDEGVISNTTLCLSCGEHVGYEPGDSIAKCDFCGRVQDVNPQDYTTMPMDFVD